MAPSAEPSLSEDPLPSPPGATLRRADTDGPAVAGGLGSWSLDGMASDAPWLPADVLETVDVPLGARLAVTFADGAAIGTWTAVLADVADRDGAVARTVAQGDGSGGSAVEVEAPPPGEWVLAVTLTRADGRGRATYSWAVSVR